MKPETKERLTAVAGMLNAASDRINEKIRDFEHALQDVGAGVTVWLPVNKFGWQLGYMKLDQDWCAVVRTGNDNPIPLTKAPRHIRVEAINMLDSLAVAIIEKMQDMLVEIEKVF